MSKAGRLKKLGCGVAAAAAIAGGTSAYGEVVLVNPPADLTTTPGGPNTSAQWDINGDGLVDFVFNDRYQNSPPGQWGIIWETTVRTFFATNGFIGVGFFSGFDGGYAFALDYGQPVSPDNPDFTTQTQELFLGAKFNDTFNGTNYTYYYGGFAGVGPNSVPLGTFAFAGFRFYAADGIHYGWIRLRVNAGIIDFVDAAYESTPNVGIFTATNPVPEPGTMALLALGAVGVVGTVAKRRRA